MRQNAVTGNSESEVELTEQLRRQWEDLKAPGASAYTALYIYKLKAYQFSKPGQYTFAVQCERVQTNHMETATKKITITVPEM